MMSIGCALPKKLRMLTSGGYNFNSDCVNYVTSRSEIENIVDCFGTAKCPPPMAIRHLKNDTGSYFTWVNKFVMPISVPETGQLSFTTTDGGFGELLERKVVTNDLIEFIDGSYNFKMVGKYIDKIRMSHILYSMEEFKRLFTEYSGIQDFGVIFETVDGLKNPVIMVDVHDYSKASETISKYHVEAKLKFHVQ